MTTKTVIDTNVYWLPEELFTDESLRNEFIRAVPQEYDCKAIAYELEDGRKAIRIEKPVGCENLNYFQGDYKLENQLQKLDEAGVSKAVMKLPGAAEWLTLSLAKKFNDMQYDFAKASHGRMIPLACVPLSDDAEVLAELDRCINELHFHGVQVSAHYGNFYLDDARFRGFFRHVNDLKIPVYVHHTPVPVDCGSLLAYNNLRRSFGRCQDQITAIGRELFSGMFAELPNVKMIHSMLGGGYFTYKEMLMPRDSGGGRFDTNTDAIRKYLKDNIYFEMSHAQPWGKTNLEAAVKILGADHILYGSSYPVKEVWLTGGPTFVESLDVTEEEKEQMLHTNAEEIYDIHD